MHQLIAPIIQNALRTTMQSRAVRTCRAGASVYAGLALVLSSATVAAAQTQEVAPPSKPPVQQRGMPAMPLTPAAVAELVEVIPFELATSFEHNMRKDRASYTRGHVLVIRAPEPYLVPRQVAEPVLLVGGQTAERINTGVGTGLLVVVVPEWTERAADGTERAGDPAAARIWFASPELPERVDAAWIEAEETKARAAGVVAQAPRAATFSPSKTVKVADRNALGRVLADVVERHAPQESDRIEALRAAQ
ncbi:MAG: hypothetical protein ACKO3W_10610 [bacterium]